MNNQREEAALAEHQGATGGDVVRDETDLEASIGRKSPSLDMKVIDHLDAFALQWIDDAVLGFATIGGAGRVGLTLVDAQLVTGNVGLLSIAVEALEAPELVVTGASFGSIWLIPGLRETLRVNGKIVEVSEGWLHVVVDECFGHCAKSLIRSDFWAGEPATDRVHTDINEFALTARFAALATINESGDADISPKGDPAGMLTRVIDGELCFSERPGNRRADSLRNLLEQPRLSLALLIPGGNQLVTLSGKGQISSNKMLRERFAVSGKVPTLVVQVTNMKINMSVSKVLSRVRVWPAYKTTSQIRPAKMFAAHMRLNKANNVSARVARAMVAVPGLMQKSLDQDYKNNLY